MYKYIECFDNIIQLHKNNLSIQYSLYIMDKDTHLVFYDEPIYDHYSEGESDIDDEEDDAINSDMYDDMENVVIEIKSQIKFMKSHINDLENQNKILHNKLNKYIAIYGDMDKLN